MDERKMLESIDLFKRFYVQDRSFYDRDERGWKVALAEKFQAVFALDSLASSSFLESLRTLFDDPQATHLIVLLSGGVFYQHRRFLDLLLTDLDSTLIAGFFQDLLFSHAPVRSRINRFKAEVDALYGRLARRSTIQLNLISQFLGLCFPKEHYIYKSTEFREAAAYFGYTDRLRDTSAGGMYEHYHKFAREIRAAMHQAGLDEVDFIDVQTFVFRKDWYVPSSLQHEIEQFQRETARAESLPIGNLVNRIKKARPRPARVVHGVYYYRDPNIAAFVKSDTRGICDLCRQQAPFESRPGVPYLECHHIVPLATEGRDEVKNCVALCPNCHAKMHILGRESDKQMLFEVAEERHKRYF